MKDTVKLLFIIPTLETGGSQKVLSILLNHISSDKFEITVCVLTDTGVFYEGIPPLVKKINLRTSRVRYSAFKIHKLIRNSQPDVVFVFDVNHLNLIVGIISYFLPSNIKFITREAIVLSVFIKNYVFFKALRRILFKLTFKRFDLIICQSNYMREDLIEHFNVQAKESVVINNPVEFNKVIAASLTEERLFREDTFNIVAVGRLVYVKGFDRLIKALSLVKVQGVHLTILGDGTIENPGVPEELKDLAQRLGLTGKISFLGFVSNPHQYVRQADLLVISSHTEGFPNVALEATALGTPVVAFNSPGGIAEIIVENFNGWLVENGNIEHMALAIDKMAGLKVDRNAIADHTREKYDVSKIVPMYEKAIVDLLG